MSNLMDKIIIDAPTKELEDAIFNKLVNHFDEQEDDDDDAQTDREVQTEHWNSERLSE